MNFMVWIYVLFLLGFINWLIAFIGLKKFVSERTSIKTIQCLEDFKSMARKQMYQALLQIVFLGAMGVLGVVGIIKGKLGIVEILIFLTLNIINFVLGAYSKGFEKKSKALPVEDASLSDEYASVSKSWVKKPFPDF